MPFSLSLRIRLTTSLPVIQSPTFSLWFVLLIVTVQVYHNWCAKSIQLLRWFSLCQVLVGTFPFFLFDAVIPVDLIACSVINFWTSDFYGPLNTPCTYLTEHPVSLAISRIVSPFSRNFLSSFLLSLLYCLFRPAFPGFLFSKIFSLYLLRYRSLPL